MRQLCLFFIFCLTFSISKSQNEVVIRINSNSSSIQWYKVGYPSDSLLVGQTSDSLTVNNVGVYYATYNNGSCYTVSEYGVIVNCTGGANDTAYILKANFSSGATYQWYNENNPISGATADTLKIYNPGKYYVKYGGSLCGNSPSFTLSELCCLPLSLGGDSSVSIGSTANVTPNSGGTWSSSNTGVATVTNAGVVTGVSVGAVTLSFTDSITGCKSTKVFSVKPIPCSSVSWAKFDGFSGQSNYTSPQGIQLNLISGSYGVSGFNNSNPSLWQLISGNILPTRTSSFGFNCPENSTLVFDLIYPNVISPTEAIIGVDNLFGPTGFASSSTASFTFYDNSNSPIPGTFYSNYRLFTSQPASTITGNTVSGATSSGLDGSMISVIPSNLTVLGISKVRVTINVPDNPTGTADAIVISMLYCCQTTLGGATSVCVGSTATVTPTTGGTWTSSNTGIATVTNAGVVTGVSEGNVTLTFTNNNTCVNTKSFAVNALPVLGGAISVCVGSTATVTPTTGGTWASSNTGVATVTNSGVVTGVSSGTVTLIFIDSNNCENTKSFIVESCCGLIVNGGFENNINSNCTYYYPSTNPNGIYGWTVLNDGGSGGCDALLGNLSCGLGVHSGLWAVDLQSHSNASGNFSCQNTYTTGIAIQQNVNLVIGQSYTLTFYGAALGSSSNDIELKINNTVVQNYNFSATYQQFIYTFTPTTTSNTIRFINRNNTGAVTAIDDVCLNLVCNIVLGGSTSVCVGSTATVTPTTGGTWSSSNTGVATITNAGVVTGVSAGTVTLTFTDNNNCVNTKTFTVNPLPVLGGATSVCVGSTATVTPTTGGTWTSSNTGVATVTNAGVVTGVSDGSVTLTFAETSTGCSQTKTFSSNMVDAGTDKTGCQFGNVTMSGSGNGSWSIGAGSAGSASISDPANPTSTVSGFSLPGIYYLIRNNNGCVDTALVTINAQPSVNASQTTVCPGNSVNLVGTNPNTGIWTAQSGNPSGATLGSTSSGIANVTFSNSIPTPSNFYFIYTANGCSASQQIQVISCNQPPVITDTTVVTAVNTAITVCRSITDPDAGQNHSVTLCGGPNHGNITSGLTVNNASSPHQICLTYNPVINYTGMDTICIITCDNGTPVLCDTAKIYINIACPVQPTVDANPDSLTICTNEAVVINFTPTPSNATVYWYNNLGAFGEGNISTLYINNSTNVDSIVHFYAYSTTHNGGCISDTIHIPVRVKPLPIVTTSFCIDTVCPNELLFCQFFSSLNGTTFTWTNNFGQTGTGNSISQTFQNNTNSIIHYVYTVNATSNGCTVNNAKQIDIYVLPSSTVIASPTVDTICAGQSANIQLSGATSYSWQGDLFPMHTTGTGSIINSTLRNDGIQPYTVDYNIQAVSNGCLGTSTARVVVLPNILLNPSLTSLTICSGSRAEISITSVPSSLPISWTTNTGFSGNGNVNMFLTNNGNTPVTHQFTFTTNWNGCTQQITIPVVVTP